MVKKIDTKSTAAFPDSNACSPANSSAIPAPAIPPAPPEFGSDLWRANLREALAGIDLVRPPKFTVGTTVPERVYRAILRFQPGISQFIEDAINGFDGDMRALVVAANELAAERKTARFDTGVRSISGRVPKTALTKLQGIVAALKDIPGMSSAKVLGGLVQILLTKDAE